MVEEALEEALAAGALVQAVTIITQARQTVVNRENWPRMRRWLERFPYRFVEQTPALWIIQAWQLHNQFRVAEIEALLDRIEANRATMRASGDMTHPGILDAEVAYLRAQSCFWRTDGEECLRRSQSVLEIVPDEYTMLRGGALLYFGLAAQMEGKQEAGFAHLRYEYDIAANRSASMAASILLGLTIMEWVAGDLNATARMAERLCNLAEQHQLVASRAWGHYFLGCAHYWRNELVKAAHYFGAVVDRPFGANGMAVAHSHFGLALIFAAQNRLADARAIVENGLALAIESGNALIIEQAEAFEVRFALLLGKKAAAIAWANQHVQTRPGLPMIFLELRPLTLVRILSAQGEAKQVEQAAAMLNDVRDFVRRTHNTVRQIDVLAFEALVHRARRESQAALAAVQAALALAAPAEIVRPFVDLGPDMAALLYDAATQGPHADFAAHVLAYFAHGSVQGAARSSLPQPQEYPSAPDSLTDREMDVLALLGQRLSNKEIADVLVVSTWTVKTHTHNVLAKLQAKNRREAVARARSLGLLNALS